MPVDLTDSETAIVEGTPYEHDEHGRVEVLLVADDAVTFETGDRVGGVPETILSESAGLTASEATDRSNGRFVVELELSELPSAGQYYEEVRAEWPSGRTFSDVVGSVTVERARVDHGCSLSAGFDRF